MELVWKRKTNNINDKYGVLLALELENKIGQYINMWSTGYKSRKHLDKYKELYIDKTSKLVPIYGNINACAIYHTSESKKCFFSLYDFESDS